MRTRTRKVVITIIAVLAVATVALAQSSREITFTQLLERGVEIARYLTNGGKPMLMLTPGWECQETVDNLTWGGICVYEQQAPEVVAEDVPAEDDTSPEAEATEEGGRR